MCSVFREATQVLCIIFVERIMTAKVLDIIVKRVADLSHLEASYLTGNAMSPNHQNETLESFRSGKVYEYPYSETKSKLSEKSFCFKSLFK